jgi:hypothetical protein
MSGTLPAHDPVCVEADSRSVELLLEARPRDLGGFSVRRVLPSGRRRMVGQRPLSQSARRRVEFISLPET